MTTTAAGTAPGRRPSRFKRSILLALGVTVGLVAATAFVDLPAEFLVVHDRFDTADAALVMAGDLNYERTTTAAGLVLQGRARLLILTGGEPGPGDSSSSLRAWARKAGVDDRLIRTESVSTNTWTSMEAVRPILRAEGVRTLVLVTSPYHQRRTWLTARRLLGPDVSIFNHPAEPSWWVPRGWWRTRRSRGAVLSEYLKLAYYTVRD